MNKLLFLFIFFLMISACGSADDFIEDLEEVGGIDSIRIIPPADSTNLHATDTITIVKNDTTIVGNDTIITPKDSILADSIHSTYQPEITYTKLFTLNSTSKNTTQGFAVHDKYLFNCHHTNDVIDIFDLETKKAVGAIHLEPETIVHCNNVNFGSERYLEDDKFPLLYIQQRGYASKLNVYRIVSKGDSAFAAEKIQTISFESCSWCINTIDKSRNLLYTFYGYNGNNYLSCFRMPSYREGDITIHPKSAYKTFFCPYKKVGQDTAFDDKYLYITCGYSKEGELWRIDMDNKMARLIDLTKYKLNGEPEGLDIYKGDILLSFLSKALYRITIVENQLYEY